MKKGHIDHQVTFPSEVDVSDLQVALFGAAAGSDVLASGGTARAAAPLRAKQLTGIKPDLS